MQGFREDKKIIIMGMAESGKSTIIDAVTKRIIPSRNARYKATINYQRKKMEILETNLTLFDLGGQVLFLDRFTDNLKVAENRLSPFLWNIIVQVEI